MIEDFEKEVQCTYKGETYSVRDNGSVMRHPHEGKKTRPNDYIWTFGNYNEKTGYAEIAGVRIHRIVATAFHGEAPSAHHVVDHIDTNRRNNRPENLRWVTKLENILLNPITLKKILSVCGSVEEFLKNPSKLNRVSIDKNFEWMRAVTKEEAHATLERMMNWANSDKTFSGGTLGDWIYHCKEEKSNYKQHILSNNKALNLEHGLNKNCKLDKETFNVLQQNTYDLENNGVIYRTRSEIYSAIKAQLESEKTLMLPSIVLPTAGKEIKIKESWLEEFEKIEYRFEGKAFLPKSMIIKSKNGVFALLIRMKNAKDANETIRLKTKGFNILEIDLSWIKTGITEETVKYILQTDVSKKKWIYHDLINKAEDKLREISEQVVMSGNGVAHTYYSCPLTSQSVEDLDCWDCEFRVASDITEISCFGKSQVETYQDLLSIVHVEKEDNTIVSISYNKNGKIITKKFSKNMDLPGKTIFQLWDEKKSNQLIAFNIFSNWYVLVEEDPKDSFEKTGKVYGKISKNIEDLEVCKVRNIFSFDSCCWKIVK